MRDVVCIPTRPGHRADNELHAKPGMLPRTTVGGHETTVGREGIPGQGASPRAIAAQLHPTDVREFAPFRRGMCRAVAPHHDIAEAWGAYDGETRDACVRDFGCGVRVVAVTS